MKCRGIPDGWSLVVTWMFTDTNVGAGVAASIDLPTGDSTASSIGRICESCLSRMTKSHAGSNFFQPAL